MATYLKYRDGWRVQICVQGIRESRSFESKREAKEWAQEREWKLKYPGKKEREEKNRNSSNTTPQQTTSQIVKNALPLNLSVGIFVLIKDGNIVYIGKSLDLQETIKQYLNSKKFDHINVIECPEKNLDKYFEHYIAIFNPVLNNPNVAEFNAREQSCQIS